MDADNILPALEPDMGDSNGAGNELPCQEEEGVVHNVVTGIPGSNVGPDFPNVSLETLEGSNNCGMDPKSSVIVENSDMHEKSNGSAVSDEVELKDTHQVKDSKSQNGQGKSIAENLLSSDNDAATQVKKTSNAKEVKMASNATLVAKSLPKQTAAKSRSFNARYSDGNNPHKTIEPTSGMNIAHKSKHLAKSVTKSSAEIVSQSECAMGKEKLKPLRKGHCNKNEGDPESTFPTSGDANPHRVGKLPSYSFSFSCDERAERRKEFYSKLVEKINAKEVEKCNQQAKSKETQEAHIKMLRKSLTFKATPMPSFYQEPAPPKVELNKIPPTRPRSPKLGRKKSPAVDDEADGSHSRRSGLVSLDVRVSQNKPVEGPSPAHSKKPQRRSLPRLPSQKISLASTTNDDALLVTQKQENVTNGALTLAQEEQKVVPSAEPGQTQAIADNEPAFLDQVQPTFEQELITEEH
ncbi:hypothetical protein Nepgr_014296 [Nepenthes gracilis]|uniref:TPX2 C-terminal domain-containing protein n=1 Tax=Nepenthes gracilis TaxID=150966 RepID=A0AAD3SIW9_NEPGR|nr:hypothetical protein Nepgr_014296 [Nepenthes gracilis]